MNSAEFSEDVEEGKKKILIKIIFNLILLLGHTFTGFKNIK